MAREQVNTLFDALPWAQASRRKGTELNEQLQNLNGPVLRPANLVQPPAPALGPAASSKPCGSVSRRHPGETISLLQESQPMVCRAVVNASA